MADAEEPIEDIESTAEEDTQGEGAPKRRLFGPSLVRTLLYVMAALVLIVISGTIAYLVAKRVGAQPGQDRISEEQTEKKAPYTAFVLGEFSLNTSDPTEPHFIKISISLGYDAEKNQMLPTELNARRAQLRDIVITTVGAKKHEDLLTQDQRDELKEELLDKINSVLRDGETAEIYFTEFVLT